MRENRRAQLLQWPAVPFGRSGANCTFQGLTTLAIHGVVRIPCTKPHLLLCLSSSRAAARHLRSYVPCRQIHPMAALCPDRPSEAKTYRATAIRQPIFPAVLLFVPMPNAAPRRDFPRSNAQTANTLVDADRACVSRMVFADGHG